MKTASSIMLLIVFGAVAYFLSLYFLNIAGVPGALLAGSPGKRSKGRFICGYIVAALGQSYVYLVFTAFVVNWTRLAARRDDVVGFLLWPFAFLAVLIPIYSSLIGARLEARKHEFANPQVEALHFTFLAALLGFFVFAFAPSVIRPAWGWLPFAPGSTSQASTDEAQLEYCAMAVVGCVHFSASDDPSDLASVAGGKKPLMDMIQGYDKASLDEVCALVDESLRFERSLQKDLEAYMEESSRTSNATKFKMSGRTRQILDNLPSKLRAFLEVNVVEVEQLGSNNFNPPKNWRELMHKGTARIWAMYGQTYSELLGRPMPDFAD